MVAPYICRGFENREDNRFVFGAESKRGLTPNGKSRGSELGS
jgi:hypothetical protein